MHNCQGWVVQVPGFERTTSVSLAAPASRSPTLENEQFTISCDPIQQQQGYFPDVVDRLQFRSKYCAQLKLDCMKYNLVDGKMKMNEWTRTVIVGNKEQRATWKKGKMEPNEKKQKWRKGWIHMSGENWIWGSKATEKVKQRWVGEYESKDERRKKFRENRNTRVIRNRIRTCKKIRKTFEYNLQRQGIGRGTSKGKLAMEEVRQGNIEGIRAR